MANRKDYFFKQLVTEAQLDAGFQGLEDAEFNIMKDLGVLGVLAAGVAVEDSPTSLSVDITGPMVGRTQNGERLAFASTLNVDIGTDGDVPLGGGGTGNGVSTAVSTTGFEKWVSVFMKFARLESDPDFDGLGNPINFTQDESFQFVLVQSAEVAEPILPAAAPATPAGHIRIADVRRKFSQTVIVSADIDVTNRIEALSDWADLSSHILATQDPHGADMTLTGKLLLGASGAPAINEPLHVTGAANDFVFFTGPNSMTFIVNLDAAPILDMQSGTTVTGVEQSYFRIREGGGLVVYMNARGILGAASGAGNGTRIRVDEPSKQVDFFSGTEAATATGGGWDVLLRAGKIKLNDHGSAVPTGFVDIDPIGNQPRIDISGQTDTDVDDYAIRTNESIGAFGFTDNLSLANGVRLRIRDALKLAQFGSGAAGATLDVPVQAASFEPKEAHNDIALSAAQLPQMGEGRVIMSHGSVTGGVSPTLQAGHVNVLSVVQNSTGNYTITFDQALSHTTYTVVAGCIDSTAASFTCAHTRAVGSFVVETFNQAGTNVDRDFSFIVVAHP